MDAASSKSFKVRLAVPKRARVRRARVKPEAHSYVNVKTYTDISNRRNTRQKIKPTYEYCAF